MVLKIGRSDFTKSNQEIAKIIIEILRLSPIKLLKILLKTIKKLLQINY